MAGCGDNISRYLPYFSTKIRYLKNLKLQFPYYTYGNEYYSPLFRAFFHLEGYGGHTENAKILDSYIIFNETANPIIVDKGDITIESYELSQTDEKINAPSYTHNDTIQLTFSIDMQAICARFFCGYGGSSTIICPISVQNF